MPDPTSSSWAVTVLTFLAGIATALFSAGVAVVFQQMADRRQKLAQARFEIYMKLMELHGLYFWVASAEMRTEALPKDIGQQIWTLAWKVADQLRTADSIKETPEILEVLMLADKRSAVDRHEQIGELIKRLGNSVNPRYSKIVRQLSEQNLRQMTLDSSAPGSFNMAQGLQFSRPRAGTRSPHDQEPSSE